MPKSRRVIMKRMKLFVATLAMSAAMATIKLVGGIKMMMGVIQNQAGIILMDNRIILVTMAICSMIVLRRMAILSDLMAHGFRKQQFQHLISPLIIVPLNILTIKL